MHYALPPRKDSKGPLFIPSRSSNLRRGRLRSLGWILGSVFLLLFLVSRLRGRGTVSKENLHNDGLGKSHIVLVTAVNPERTPEHQQMIEENRKEYAARHGYSTFLPSIVEYNLAVPKYVNATSLAKTWAKIPAVRHAMTTFPQSTHFFFLDELALIMNPTLSVEEHILSHSRLGDLMIPEQAIVPSNAIIKTLSSSRPQHVDLILTQDDEGLSQNSFIIRRGEWAKYFLDAWFDPLYRSYNFQRAEAHALEHLVQWHVTVLSRLALVPQTIMNSYVRGQEQGLYHEGQFVLNLKGCDKGIGRSCEQEMRPFYERFHELLAASAAR